MTTFWWKSVQFFTGLVSSYAYFQFHSGYDGSKQWNPKESGNGNLFPKMHECILHENYYNYWISDWAPKLGAARRKRDKKAEESSLRLHPRCKPCVWAAFKQEGDRQMDEQLCLVPSHICHCLCCFLFCLVPLANLFAIFKRQKKLLNDCWNSRRDFKLIAMGFQKQWRK